jgi:PAS domain S-box-containing protein
MDLYSRAVLDSLDTNVAVIDDKGMIVDVNRSWLDFALDNGVSSLDKIGVGVNYFEVCEKAHGGRSEEAPVALVGLKSVLDGSTTYFDLEYPCDSPDWRRRFLMHATPFDLDDRSYVIVNHINITKLKLAEQALQKAHDELEARVKERSKELEDVNRALTNEVEERKRAEEMFRSTFNQAAVGIAHIALDGRFIRLNQKYCDIVGYTHDELIKRTYQSITDPDDLGMDLNYNNQLIKGKIDKFSSEKRYIRKGGSIVWVNLTVSIVRGEGRLPKYFIAVIEDITERKRTEDAVRKSKEMLRLVMDNIPQAIFWKDINSVYLGCNKVFAHFAGVRTPENIVGKTDYDLAWTRAEAEAFRRDDRRVMDTNKPIYHIIEPQLQAGGKHAWLDTNKIPMHDSEGIVVGILGTYEDITERREAELELEKAKDQAELYVDLMSHDISNMNQAMLGYLEMAIELLRLQGKEKELVERPMEIIGHSSKLIDNVKKLRRLETGKVPLKKIDLGTVLSRAKAEYQSIPGRDIRINYTPVTGYIVMANDLLADVFSNLVDNAIKYGHDPLLITMEAATVEVDGKKYYRVKVEDNGPGIPDVQKKNLFVDIKMGERKLIRRGLGLRLVKTLVHSFNGKVWVEDLVPGDYMKGARFVVMLPAVEK